MSEDPGTVGRRLGFFCWYTLPLLVYLGAIAWVSHRPGVGKPWFPHFDKVAHLVEYAPVGFLGLRWLSNRWPRRAFFGGKAVLAAGLFGVAYGIIDEFHQSFVPGRQVDVLDVLADGCGALIGGAVYTAIFLRRKAR